MKRIPRNFTRLLPLFAALGAFITHPLQGVDWNTFRIAESGVGIPEDLEDFSLVAISGDASVVAGNEVADWNLFPNRGPVEYRNQYPFYWKDGMQQIQEIMPNTDELIEFRWGYRGRVTGMSRDGKWVVGEYAAAGESVFHKAFLYSIEHDTFEYLGDFGWSEIGGIFSSKRPEDYYLASEATGISGDGSVVVGWARDLGGLPKAFRWTREEGMVKIFDYIYIWFPEREDRILAISDDGRRVAGDVWALRVPDGEKKYQSAFYMDDFDSEHQLPIPNGFTLQGISEISGPSNSILGTIRSELISAPEQDRLFPPAYEEAGVRWFPERDNYEVYPTFSYSDQLSAVSQTDSGNLLTLLMEGIAPTDGQAWYGLLWTRETGLMDTTGFLEREFEIDFGHGAVSRALPSHDGKYLVAEVYTGSGHALKALARFELTRSKAPLARIFPQASYRNGWRDTTMGRLYCKDFPYLWWDHFGWIWLHEESSTEDAVWFWNPDLGWCCYPCQGGTHRYFLYAFASGEWIYVLARQGWLYSPSRGWFTLI